MSKSQPPSSLDLSTLRIQPRTSMTNSTNSMNPFGAPGPASFGSLSSLSNPPTESLSLPHSNPSIPPTLTPSITSRISMRGHQQKSPESPDTPSPNAFDNMPYFSSTGSNTSNMYYNNNNNNDNTPRSPSLPATMSSTMSSAMYSNNNNYNTPYKSQSYSEGPPKTQHINNNNNNNNVPQPFNAPSPIPFNNNNNGNGNPFNPNHLNHGNGNPFNKRQLSHYNNNNNNVPTNPFNPHNLNHGNAHQLTHYNNHNMPTNAQSKPMNSNNGFNNNNINPQPPMDIPNINDTQLKNMFKTLLPAHCTSPTLQFRIDKFQYQPTINNHQQPQNVNTTTKNFYFRSRKIMRPYRRMMCSCGGDHCTVTSNNLFSPKRILNVWDSDKHIQLMIGLNRQEMMICCGKYFPRNKLIDGDDSLDEHLNNHRK